MCNVNMLFSSNIISKFNSLSPSLSEVHNRKIHFTHFFWAHIAWFNKRKSSQFNSKIAPIYRMNDQIEMNWIHFYSYMSFGMREASEWNFKRKIIDWNAEFMFILFLLMKCDELKRRKRLTLANGIILFGKHFALE